MSTKKIATKIFIDEEIVVGFNILPLYTKEPPCPNSFMWREKKFLISALLFAWYDFERHGRMERNMQPEHDARARLKGSWGVGRYHFQVDTKEGRQFELYFDRSPSKAGDRNGHWFLLAELDPTQSTK
jgi:hypothetical protein